MLPPVSARRFVFPSQGDTLASIAASEFPGDDDAAGRLFSWNLHLALRRAPLDTPDQLLGTDIVYLEPPRS